MVRVIIMESRARKKSKRTRKGSYSYEFTKGPRTVIVLEKNMTSWNEMGGELVERD